MEGEAELEWTRGHAEERMREEKASGHAEGRRGRQTPDHCGGCGTMQVARMEGEANLARARGHEEEEKALATREAALRVRGRVREARAEMTAAGTGVRACVEDAGRALGEAAAAIVVRTPHCATGVPRS